MKSFLATIAFLLPGVALGVDYYASSGGSGTTCSLASPCSLATAFCTGGSCNYPIRTGDTLNLRGPWTINCSVTTNCRGITLGKNTTGPGHILIRPYPADGRYSVKFECNNANNNSACIDLHANGGHRWFVGFDINNTSATTRVQPTGTTNCVVPRMGSSRVGGNGDKFINNIDHNNCVGPLVSTGDGATWGNDIEIYGNMIYYVGYDEIGSRAHGHAVYIQSGATSPANGVRVRDNVMHDSFDIGAHSYTEGGRLAYITYEGNTNYLNGTSRMTTVGGTRASYIIGANGGAATDCDPAHNPKVALNPIFTRNISYGDVLYGLALGYAKGTCNATVTDNYFDMGTTANAAVHGVNNLGTKTITGNVFIGKISGDLQPATYTNNTYLAAEPASGKIIKYRPNIYEVGRGMATVFNYDLSATVNLDLSQMGAYVGEQYEIHQAQDPLHAALATGTYSGGTVPVPTQGLTVERPTGAGMVAPAETGPKFNVYVVWTQNAAPPPNSTFMFTANNTATRAGTRTSTATSPVSHARTPPPIATQNPDVRVEP